MESACRFHAGPNDIFLERYPPDGLLLAGSQRRTLLWTGEPLRNRDGKQAIYDIRPVLWLSGRKAIPLPYREVMTPETSLTSRELADEIIRNTNTGVFYSVAELDKAAALIDAWVRVREAEALRDKLVDLLPRLQGHYSVLRDFQVQIMQAEIKDAESALATARKQLEEKKGEPA